ncbi:hypothetical protein [Roseibium sp.]
MSGEDQVVYPSAAGASCSGDDAVDNVALGVRRTDGLRYVHRVIHGGAGIVETHGRGIDRNHQMVLFKSLKTDLQAPCEDRENGYFFLHSITFFTLLCNTCGVRDCDHSFELGRISARITWRLSSFWL